MTKILYSCIIIFLIFSCTTRPKPISAFEIKEVEDHINLLTNYEKPNRKEKDTVFLNLILGSRKNDVRNSIQKLVKKGVIIKEKESRGYILKDLPDLTFYTGYFHDLLQSIVISGYVSIEDNDNLTYSIEQNYGEDDIAYFINGDENNYWIKGDLMIEKTASFLEARFEEDMDKYGVNIKYTKLSIKDKVLKEREKEREKEKIKQERKETNERFLQIQKKDSIAKYF